MNSDLKDIKKERLIRSSFRLIVMVFKTGRIQISLQIFLRIICGLLPAATALIWQRILLSINNSNQQPILFLFISLAIIGGLSISYSYFSEIADTLIRNRISIGLQKSIHKKADELPMDDYETPILADMINRASGVFCYGDAVGFMMTVFGLIQQSISIISMAFVVWSFQPVLIFGALILLIPAIVKLGLNKKRINLDLQLSPARREAGVFREYLTGRTNMKDVRMMNISNYFLEKWEVITKHIFSEERRSNIKITFVRLCVDVIERGTTIGSYMLCIYLVLSKKISIADFGAIIVLIGQFLQNSSSLMDQINGIHGESLSVQSAIGYFNLLREKREKTLISTDEINFNNVAYHYPENEKYAVKNINLSLNQGETIAIVGKNGSGKTTLSKLILGLINPSSGEITIGNEPMIEINYLSLYKPTSSIFQDYIHYAMSVKDNINIADDQLSLKDDEFYQFLNDLGITFINEDSNITLQTELGVEYGGADISGGQWQQLAIARAAYRKAQIVVLDEPSSALDPLREAELYDTFRKLCQDKIGVIITHRLGMCAFANKILVMDNGEIIEYGTKDELLKNDGIYARMYHSQQELYTGWQIKT
jgi:ABC-type multidrug transport system fused ATPase/permease subunit